MGKLWIRDIKWRSRVQFVKENTLVFNIGEQHSINSYSEVEEIFRVTVWLSWLSIVCSLCQPLSLSITVSVNNCLCQPLYFLLRLQLQLATHFHWIVLFIRFGTTQDALLKSMEHINISCRRDNENRTCWWWLIQSDKLLSFIADSKQDHQRFNTIVKFKTFTSLQNINRLQTFPSTNFMLYLLNVLLSALLRPILWNIILCKQTITILRLPCMLCFPF